MEKKVIRTFTVYDVIRAFEECYSIKIKSMKIKKPMVDTAEGKTYKYKYKYVFEVEEDDRLE